MRHEKLSRLAGESPVWEIWSAEPSSKFCILTVTEGMKRKQQAFRESIEPRKRYKLVEAEIVKTIEGNRQLERAFHPFVAMWAERGVSLPSTILRWKPNVVAFWDNRWTQHYALSDYFPHRRRVRRATILGDRPV